MAKEQEVNVQTEERPLVTFLKVASSEGAHLKTPTYFSDQQWARVRNIIGLYSGTGLTYEAIGDEKRYALTKQRIQKIFENGMNLIWQNCSWETRQEFPVDEIIADFTSWKRGSVTREIGNLVRGGIGYSQLKERGFSLDQIGSARGRLKSREIYVPYKEGKYDELIQELSQTEDREKQKELIGKVTKKVYYDNCEGENPLFIPVSKLARSAGFHFFISETESFVNSLSNNNIPVGKVEYELKSGKRKGGTRHIYFILCRLMNEGKELFLKDASLARFLKNPVELICGEDTLRIPTVYEIGNDELYRSVGSLLRSIGRRATGPGFPVFSQLDGCPVPVFGKKSEEASSGYKGVYYLVENEQELVEFFQRKFSVSVRG